MDAAWFEPLRPICKEACVEAGSTYPLDVVLFYVARWCQKRSGEASPDIAAEDEPGIREVAGQIVANLAQDGDEVTLLVDGDAEAWTDLRRLLFRTLRARGEPAAGDRADEALQKVAEVLLTGTPPALAAERLRDGPEGPGNEYVFTSPFRNWARAVAKNLVTDTHRREARDRAAPVPEAPKPAPAMDRARLEEARDALPSLVEAIRDLPTVQRSVMVASLCRPDVDEVVGERLHAIDPDLFPEPGTRSLATDGDIAEHLGTTARLVTANRSVARRKLAAREERWELLLDFLLPHRSTKPTTRDED